MSARSRDDIDPGILNLTFVSKWARHSLYSTPLQANIYGVLTTYMEYSFLATKYENYCNNNKFAIGIQKSKVLLFYYFAVICDKKIRSETNKNNKNDS